jgi:signal peptidase
MNWFIVAVLALMVGSLAFLYFTPSYNLFLVRSESMTPAINMGDLIITGPPNGATQEKIRPGTIITFERSNGPVTHRVQSINGEELVTKGDAAEDPDPWTVRLNDVRGVYLFKVPRVGYLTTFVQTKLGWFLAIIIPSASLVILLVKDIVKEALSDA